MGDNEALPDICGADAEDNKTEDATDEENENVTSVLENVPQDMVDPVSVTNDCDIFCL